MNFRVLPRSVGLLGMAVPLASRIASRREAYGSLLWRSWYCGCMRIPQGAAEFLGVSLRVPGLYRTEYELLSRSHCRLWRFIAQLEMQAWRWA